MHFTVCTLFLQKERKGSFLTMQWLRLCLPMQGVWVRSLIDSRKEYWSGLPFPPPGESAWPRDWTHVSCIGRQILLPLCHLGTPLLRLQTPLHRMTTQPSSSTPEYTPQRTGKGTQTESCVVMSIAALLATAKGWEQPVSLSWWVGKPNVTCPSSRLF